MLKRFAAPLLGAAVIAASLATAAVAQDKPTMGVVVKIGGIPWFNAMEVGIKEQGEAHGRRRLHDRPDQRRSRRSRSAPSRT